MNLKELKARIDFLTKAYPDAENLKVVITTKGNSMCGREYTNIKGINRGFDWFEKFCNNHGATFEIIMMKD